MYDFEVWYKGMAIDQFKANSQEHADKLVKQLYSGDVSAKPTSLTQEIWGNQKQRGEKKE